MKTATFKQEFSPRAFLVRDNLVQIRPNLTTGDKRVHKISETTASLSPLTATMQIWVELLHSGKNDPVGHDRLHVHLTLSVRRIWIGNPARELLHTECDSAKEFEKWLVSIKRALIAENHLAILPRFPDETLESVFAPFFDAAAALRSILREDLLVRMGLWIQHSIKQESRMSPLPNRLTLKFS